MVAGAGAREHNLDALTDWEKLTERVRFVSRARGPLTSETLQGVILTRTGRGAAWLAR